MYTLRRVNANTYDVFIGNQWGDHSRIKQGRSSTYVVSGNKLPYAFLKHLHSFLAFNMPINYDQPHERTLNNCFNVLGNSHAVC